MTKTMQAKYPGWRNIKIADTLESSSVNLDIISHNYVGWRYIRGQPDHCEVPGEQCQAVGGELQQVDGGITPASLTPETAFPDIDDASSLGAVGGSMPSLDWDNYRSDPTFVNDDLFSPNVDRFNTPLNSSFDVNNLNLSSDATASDVVDLHGEVVVDAPPPLPPGMQDHSQSYCALRILANQEEDFVPLPIHSESRNVVPHAEILTVWWISLS